jgi:hypothetical protein
MTYIPKSLPAEHIDLTDGRHEAEEIAALEVAV